MTLSYLFHICETKIKLFRKDKFGTGLKTTRLFGSDQSYCLTIRTIHNNTGSDDSSHEETGKRNEVDGRMSHLHTYTDTGTQPVVAYILR